MDNGSVFWFTGLSGSGKTTIANGVADVLRRRGKTVCILDGDAVRDKLTKHLTFSPEDIIENNRIIAELCSEERRKYDHILVPVISPFEEGRRVASDIVGKGLYVVFVNSPLDNVIERDVKGLYEKALKGEIKNFIGLSDNVPYQEPENPDLELDTVSDSPEKSIDKLVNFITSTYER